MDSPERPLPAAGADPAEAASGRQKVPPLFWLLLAVAIVSEVAATSLLKLTEGFTRLWPSVIVICCYELSFILLTVVVRKIAVPVVYATWGGAGVAMVAVVARSVYAPMLAGAFGMLKAAV